MLWFLFALICVLGWGLADLFYKKGTDENDRYSHLKIAVWVGLVMGVVSLILLPFSEIRMTEGTLIANAVKRLPAPLDCIVSMVIGLIENAVKYLPASLGYIISMVIGYAGLRYLELSIASPV